MPEVVGSVCKLFADDCKLYRCITNANEQVELQDDIDKLCKWSKDWLLKFNIQKCKVVSYGNKRHDFSYTLLDNTGNRHNLTNEEGEKDLGIKFNSSLKFDEHINLTVNKVNKIIGLIKRTFKFMDKSLFLTLYKSLVRSHLDYGNLIYYPITKKNKQLIENTQRRATRMVPELVGKSYGERLKELNLPTLDFRRRRYDLIQTFKIIKGVDDVLPQKFFQMSETDLRGHSLKLAKPRANKSARLHSFSNRVVSEWNKLPEEIVNAETVLGFKSRLDKLWAGMRFDTSIV